MTYTINLKEGFNPLPDHTSIKFESFIFNGGESHIKLEEHFADFQNVTKVIISTIIRRGDDLMELLIAKDALERKGIKQFELVMLYVPYARQDRQCVDGESFTLKVFCDIINSQNFEKVWILDSHSDVAPALINKSINLSNKAYVHQAVLDLHSPNNLILVSPDAGANKKANKLFSELPGCFENLVKCDKIRDLNTGKLTGFEVFANDLQGMDCIIVDDICDGGGTFGGIAEVLRDKNVGDIYLFITHGIFSKGLDILSMDFKKIYTTNSFRTMEDEDKDYFKQLTFNLNNHI